VLKLIPDFIEHLFKVMVVDASQTCGLHTFGLAWGGGAIAPSPSLKDPHE